MLTRRSSSIAAALVLSLVVAACGGDSGTTQSPAAPDGSGPAASPGAPSSPGAVDVSGPLQIGARYGCEPAPCEPEEGAEGVADEIAYVRYNTFAEQYPDVDLTFTEANFDPQTFLTAVAAGNPPDVVRIDRALLGTFIAEGALDPLDTCITDHGIDMSLYYESAVSQGTSGDSVYAIPESYDVRIILINDSVLEEVNLTPEDIDTSDWDALKGINDQLMAKDGNAISRIGFDPKLPEFLPLWALANGTTLVSDDGLTSNLDDPKAAEALDYAVSLITAHGTAPQFFDFRSTGPGSAFFGPENQFTEDSVGAFPMEQWYLNVLANDTPDESISFQPFRDREGNNISYSGGSALAIPSSAKNKDAACEFIKVVTGADAYFAANEVRAERRAADDQAFTGVLTANRAANDRIFGELVDEESAGEFYEGVQLVNEVADGAYALPAIPAAAEFDRIWRAAVERVMNEGVPAAEALAEADQEAQDAIDGAAQ
ncbi:MAG TPA: extracellular solute-binding protein [Clostridia bacterium]|nr:extracellular solute-binding protein [Clostridia bacterium]